MCRAMWVALYLSLIAGALKHKDVNPELKMSKSIARFVKKYLSGKTKATEDADAAMANRYLQHLWFNLVVAMMVLTVFDDTGKAVGKFLKREGLLPYLPILNLVPTILATLLEYVGRRATDNLEADSDNVNLLFLGGFPPAQAMLGMLTLMLLQTTHGLLAQENSDSDFSRVLNEWFENPVGASLVQCLATVVVNMLFWSMYALIKVACKGEIRNNWKKGGVPKEAEGREPDAVVSTHPQDRGIDESCSLLNPS